MKGIERTQTSIEDTKMGTVSFEKVCSTVCYVAGVVFLVIALLGAWTHLFTMSACFATGILIAEDAKTSKD